MKKLLTNEGIKVSIITVVINFLLFLMKIIIGFICYSNALISDAVHSLSDVITTFAVIFGLIIAMKDADKNHPYGHEKIEPIFGIILAFFLFITGIGIGFVGIKSILNKDTIVIPGALALVAAIISIIVKEGMYHYTMYTAKKIKSTSMEADAWHHRSDALSSIGSFFGILGARLGFPILDPICSVIIALVIVKTAIDIFLSGVTELVDTSCDEETLKDIKKTIMKCGQNIIINDIKTRKFGSRIYIDLEIAVDGNLTVKESSLMSDKIHDKVEEQFADVKHCNIHIVPKN